MPVHPHRIGSNHIVFLRESLVDTFAPFVVFDLLNRDVQRALSNTITPSITVSDYQVYIGLEVNHTRKACRQDRTSDRILAWL